jgi:hypothetical protein
MGTAAINYLQYNAKDQAEAARLRLLSTAQLVYDGLGEPQLKKVNANDPDDNVQINYASVIVDKSVSFLFGDPLNIEIGPEEDSAPEEHLEEVWPADQRQEDFIDLATNGAIFGDAWLKLVVEDGVPRPVVLDPLNMSAVWKSKDYRKVIRFINQYNSFDEDSGKPIVYRETTFADGDHWVIREEHSLAANRNFTSSGPDIKWPYKFAPVFHCKNLPKPNEFYGKPDLSRFVLSLIYYIWRTDSLINRILRKHAHPKPVATGVKSQDLKLGIEDILFLPDKEQTLKLLEMTGDLGGAMNFRKQLREGLAEVSHVPEVATSKLESVGQLSGYALKILYGPLIDLSKKKRLMYGRLTKEVIEAMMEIGGLGGRQTQLQWPDLVPNDPKEEAETYTLLNALGVSKDTILRKLGYDPDQEKEKSDSEANDLGSALLSNFEKGAAPVSAPAAVPGEPK